jgi:hypothetical protein
VAQQRAQCEDAECQAQEFSDLEHELSDFEN